MVGENKADYGMDYTDREKQQDQETTAKEKEREEFVKSIRIIKKGIIDIDEIIRLPMDKRSKEQIFHLSCYLTYKVDFFKNEDFLDREFMLSVAERMECVCYKQYEAVMRKGEEGDKMYISVQGQLGIFLMERPNFATDSPVAMLGEFKAVGERAMEQAHDRRSATVVAMNPGETLCLALAKADYRKLVYRQVVISKGRRFTFLVKYLSELFGTWSKAKILDLNEQYCHQIAYKQGDVVYDVGHPAEVFYIVREGKLALETIIESEQNLKYPIDAKSWEVIKTKKVMQYHLRDLNIGDYFGHEEILCN